MNKEQKVISLELSKKIYDLSKKKGIKLESEYVWARHHDRDDVYLYAECEIGKHEQERVVAPALDIVELGMMLPESFRNEKQGRFDLKITKGGIDWFIKYQNDSGLIFKSNCIMCPDGLSEAMGKMYFYLLDNNLL